MTKKPKTKKVSLYSTSLLEEPLLNKGTSFTEEERNLFGLHGLLPYHISSMEEQVKRRYANFKDLCNPLAKYTFLTAMKGRNEILFYRFVLEHIQEMLPFIYTPTVGSVSTNYSLLYREQRGLYLSYPHRDKLDQIVANFPTEKVDVIVVTDGERILGLGDLGVGGMAIPIGKLALYTLFGGICPSRTLPIALDVGTNNSQMLEDPLYLGWRNSRIDGPEYDQFIEQFIQAIKKRYPNALLQWEDFAKAHAKPLLNRYRDKICSFNDDIQGTAAVALAAVYSAVNLFGSKLKDQRFAILGGGSAGMGICNQLLYAILDEGSIPKEEAYKLFYIVDRNGLFVEGNDKLSDHQKLYAHTKEDVSSWDVANRNQITLEEVVKNARPTVLIGVSTQAGAFTETIIKKMHEGTKRPMIFPLSNPTSCSEAHASDLIRWTKGEAIIATGSPFDPVAFENHLYKIAQCNNVYIFPGLGLGLIAAKATFVSDQVLIEAAKTLADHSPMKKNPYAPLFPTLDGLRSVARQIAINVVKIVLKEGNTHIENPKSLTPAQIEELVDKAMWFPDYPHYEKEGI